MSGSKVRVVCRFRPENKIEKSRGGHLAVRVSHDSEITLQSDKGPMKFTFDRVFAPSSIGGTDWHQKSVFDYAGKPIVDDIFTGYNGTIFAYGQTGSGKTHTMQGPSMQDPIEQGIIPRSIHGVFDRIYKTDEHIEFTVQVSYVEIYLERVRDLLDPKKHNLSIREHPSRGVYVEGMSEEYVTSPAEMFYFLDLGASNRATSATGMNEGSSRSHSVFVVAITQKDTTEGTSRRGNLYLVDLAGSEMVRKTGASGQQLEEAKMINKSLSALGLVINALTDATGRTTHIPYRNSKLTRMLQESLGGNARTALIICCSPSSYNAPEILSTLRFGNRAKSIQNKARVNETRSVEQLTKLLTAAEEQNKLYKKQIQSLKSKVAKYRQAAGLPDLPDFQEEDAFVSTETLTLKAKLAQDEEKIVELQAEVDDAKQNSDSLSNIIHEKDMEIAATTSRLQQLRTQIGMERTNAKSFVSRVAESLDNDATIRDLEEEDGSVEIVQARLIQELKERLITVSSKEKLESSKTELVNENKRLKDEIEALKSQLQTRPDGKSAQRSQIAADLKALNQKQRKNMDDLAGGSEDIANSNEMKHLRDQYDKNKKNTELLVGFHRTLLRRYATLEYELCDANDKLKVRSERIKDLENDYKKLKHNAKLKAKLHLTDMKKMREEHEKNLAKLKQVHEGPRSKTKNMPRRLRGKAPE